MKLIRKVLGKRLYVSLVSALMSVSVMGAVEVSEIERIANEGFAPAQNELGIMYERGEGVRQDYKKAIEWYEKAANQGLFAAQYNLGVMYYAGLGVRQDYHKAFEWFTKSANQGYANAQYNLGYMYGKGQGVRLNYKKAKEMFGLSCDGGNQEGCDAYRILKQSGM